MFRFLLDLRWYVLIEGSYRVLGMKFNKLVPELTISDYQKSLSFYTALLGFEVLFTRKDGHRFAYLELEEIQLMLSEYHNDGWNTGVLEKPYGRGINFEIALVDIEPLLNRLRAGGVALYRDPKDAWYRTGEAYSGQREFLVQDPDGYLLRFCQYLGDKQQP